MNNPGYANFLVDNSGNDAALVNILYSDERFLISCFKKTIPLLSNLRNASHKNFNSQFLATGEYCSHRKG